MIGTIIECNRTNIINFKQAFVCDDTAKRREPFQNLTNSFSLDASPRKVIGPRLKSI